MCECCVNMGLCMAVKEGACVWLVCKGSWVSLWGGGNWGESGRCWVLGITTHPPRHHSSPSVDVDAWGTKVFIHFFSLTITDNTPETMSPWQQMAQIAAILWCGGVLRHVFVGVCVCIGWWGLLMWIWNSLFVVTRQILALPTHQDTHPHTHSGSLPVSSFGALRLGW